MSAEVRAAIIRAAQEAGIDPATALAFAARESNFNPAARNSKTIRGLFQMRGDLRTKYGVGDSDDPYQQAKGWAAFFRDVKREMGGVLGRDVSDAEAYAGHHFGGRRAARMMAMDPATPLEAVFTPNEIAQNPHFAKAGTVGALTQSVIGDIDRRRTGFGGTTDLADLSHLGTPFTPDAPDLSGFGTPFEAASQNPAADMAPDLSHLGVPV